MFEKTSGSYLAFSGTFNLDIHLSKSHFLKGDFYKVTFYKVTFLKTSINNNTFLCKSLCWLPQWVEKQNSVSSASVPCTEPSYLSESSSFRVPPCILPSGHTVWILILQMHLALQASIVLPISALYLNSLFLNHLCQGNFTHPPVPSILVSVILE